MSSVTKQTITILWDSELRTAAKLLRDAFELLKILNDQTPKEKIKEANTLLYDAARAAYVALYHAEDSSPFVVCSVAASDVLESATFKKAKKH